MEGALGYIMIIAQRIKADKQINFVSIKTSTQFKMFPDLVIIKKVTTIDDEIVKEETIVKEEEKKISDDDLVNLLGYFELVSLKKLLENITPTPKMKFLMTESTPALTLETSSSTPSFALRGTNPEPAPTPDAPKAGFADIIGNLF